MPDIQTGIPIPRTTKNVSSSERTPDNLIQHVMEAGYGEMLTTEATVSTTASLLPITTLPGRKWVSIYNAGSEPLYVGSAGVTATDGGGHVIAADTQRTFPFGIAELWGITASGSTEVSVMEAA